MLATLDPALLERIAFPLSDRTKAETRAEAAAAGLAAAERRDSQEACFLAGDDYRAFLGRHGLAASDGPIVDEDGTELGRHGGAWGFTPGQRRGLGVSAAEPLYALSTDVATNTVVVGPRRALACDRVEALGTLHADAERVDAKLRHRSPAVAARVERRDGGFALELEEPAFGVARGQVVALYDDGAIVGSGVVSDAGRN